MGLYFKRDHFTVSLCIIFQDLYTSVQFTPISALLMAMLSSPGLLRLTSSLSRVVRDGGDPCSVPLSG